MTPKSIAVPAVCLPLSALFFALSFMTDARPPKDLQFVSGVISCREALHTRDRLSGFRICVGQPPLSFTYQHPDPDVALAWSTIQTARAARVRFEAQAGRPPILWALEADGKPVATLAALEASRGLWFWLYFWAGATAGGIGLLSIRARWKAGTQPRRRA